MSTPEDPMAALLAAAGITQGEPAEPDPLAAALAAAGLADATPGAVVAPEPRFEVVETEEEERPDLGRWPAGAASGVGSLPGTDPREAAQLVAAECVVLAETKDHLDWELIGELSKALEGEQQELVREAYERIEDEEDEHLYHTQGWCRELWLESLGLPAELPPMEEKRDVSTAAEAHRAKEQRQPRH